MLSVSNKPILLNTVMLIFVQNTLAYYAVAHITSKCLITLGWVRSSVILRYLKSFFNFMVLEPYPESDYRDTFITCVYTSG